ncbi:MAG: hypothetical protein M3Q95_06400 [Bacteroidota bacterium]|nr:hypothetical protein [Bacteroidota bacterium]
MNLVKLSAYTFIPALLALNSCKRDADIPEPYCKADNNGSITITLRPEHHDDPIPSLPNYPDSVFIKFNATEFPGDNPALYDIVVAGTAPSAEVVISNLSCGRYFIFMSGFDVSIAERVKGGIPVTLNYEDTSRIIKIPVTED